MTEEKYLEVDNIEQILNIFGNFDRNIKIIESNYNVQINHRGTSLKITGEEKDAEKAQRCLAGLISMTANNNEITEQNVRYAISLVEENMEDKLYTLEKDIVCITAKGRPIKPKTIGQKKYIDA
ncbi:MAG: phosphate starvation-inducible protein PhoH, partial [Clostridia bacterium]|nr:phosphate starvation-inducible protein PhoH [Clostridia bacterium]